MSAIRMLLSVGAGMLLNRTMESIKYKNPDWKYTLLAAILCIAGAFFIAFVIEA